ncbi:dUTP diphosphatase [Pedobacter sp.]|nr:dUTP diphosphatase [Candidatus Saccharibacteria bacterium]
MNISIKKLYPDVVLPKYQTQQSAGLDLAAYIPIHRVLQPMERMIVPTGLTIALPEGYEAQIRARSGLAIKHGVCLANGIGTVDADYRGEVGVLLINLGTEPFTIEPGMRIAQMVITQHERAVWTVVDELPDSTRGDGGYGSTGR